VPDNLIWIPIACAGIAVVSTVAYYVLKWKELKTLREIRDELARRPGPRG
jgi:hypothetical protein